MKVVYKLTPQEAAAVEAANQELQTTLKVIARIHDIPQGTTKFDVASNLFFTDEVEGEKKK